MRIRPLIALVSIAVAVAAHAADDSDRALKKLERNGLAFTVDAFLTHVFLGQAREVKLYLQAGMSPDAADEKGVSALHRAAHADGTDVLALLLAAGARVDPRIEGGDTPLCWAADRGHTDHVGLLIDAGADVNAVCSFEKTPLHRAVGASDTASLRRLLAAGARVEARDRHESTPLIAAADEPCPECVVLLLEAGAAVDARDRSGKTALHEAVESRSLAVVETLLAAGADANALSAAERSPLGEAERRGLAELTARLEAAGPPAGAAADAPADAGEAFRRLRDLGIQEIGAEALFTRIEARDHAVVRLLLAAGADTAARNEVGRTPLFEAVENDDLPMVEILLAAGADPEDAGSVGPSPFPHPPPLEHREAQARPRGPELDYGQTLVLSAVDSARPAILAALLDAGADPDRANDYGIVGLASAAMQGKSEHVRLLLAAGADVHAVDAAGTPVVFSAVQGGSADVVRQMLAAGADVRGKRDLLLEAAEDPEIGELLRAALASAGDRPPAPVRKPPPMPPAPEFPEPVALDFGAEPVAGEQVYRALLAIARDWQPDAELVELGTTAEGGLDDEGRSAFWSAHFYSRSAQKVNVVNLRQGRAIPYPTASNELRMIRVDESTRFDTGALHRIADEAGGRAFRARGVKPQVGLLRNPRRGPVWIFNYDDPETRRNGLSIVLDASSGEVVFRDPS